MIHVFIYHMSQSCTDPIEMRYISVSPSPYCNANTVATQGQLCATVQMPATRSPQVYSPMGHGRRYNCLLTCTVKSYQAQQAAISHDPRGGGIRTFVRAGNLR